LTGRDRNIIRKFFEDSLGLSHVENESDFLADLVFKHFPEWKDKVSEIINKLGSLNIFISEELKNFNKSLTTCLENRQVRKTLERLKLNLEILKKGVAIVKELEESLNQDTEKELRQLKNVLEIQVKQLKEVREESKITEFITSIDSHMQGNTPWRGYSDVKASAEQIINHYKQIRIAYNEKQKNELDNQLEQIKLRSDYGILEKSGKHHEVLQIIRKVFIDVDEDAAQPQLLLIKQASDRIQEAASRAHMFMDQILNESKPLVHTISLGLRNKVISDITELDNVLSSLRKKCLKELNAGIKVRFEV